MAEGNLDISGLMSKIDDLVQMIDHRGAEVAVELNGTRQNLMWIGSQINAASTLSGGGASAAIDPNKLYQKIDELIRGVNGGREAMYATNEEIGRLKDLWTKFEKDENPKPKSGAGGDEKAQWLGQRRDKWLGLEGKEKNIMLNEGLIRPDDPIFSAKPDNGGMDETELVKTWRQLGIDAREKLLEGLSYGKAKKLWDNETSDTEKGALFESFQKKQRGGKSFAREEDLTDKGKRARTHRKFERIQEAEQQEKEAKAVSEKENGKKLPTAKQSFTKALGAKGGGSPVAGVVNILSDIADVVTDGIIAQKKKEQNTWMAQQDIYLKTLETGSKIFERKLKTFSKGMQGALTSTFSGITQGVQEGAYAAASTSVDYAAESLANTFENTLDRFKLANYKAIRQEEAELENLKLTNQQINGAAGLVGGIAGMFGPVGAAIGGAITAIAKQTTKMMEANSELAFQKHQKEIEVKEKELEAITEAKNNAVSATQEAVSKVLDFSKSIETLSVKTDAAAKSMGNIIGMSGSNIQQFEDLIYKTARDLSFQDSSGAVTYFNKTAEDMLKMQSGYIEASGRNIVMSKNDHIRAFQLGEVVGDDNLAAAMLGDMDYFNQTIEDSTDLIYKMFKQANKAGVSNRKFAKDLRDNLKLAQKYTFKGGAENLMKMSIWAQKTRFNMRDLETAIDKAQEGGLEGVIKQSAQLQVLGGNFAIHSDPLGMLFDVFADPEAYGHRLNSMLKGMESFNKNTGQVDINPVEVQQLRAYANATGISYTDARAQVNQRIKGNEIDKYLGDKKFSDEQKALIYSKAQWDKDTGKWQVTLDNGERIEDISNLTKDDFTQLMPTEEAIEDYVSKIYSLLNQQGGATVHAQAVLSDETKDNLRKNIEQRIADNLKFIDENFATITKMVTDSNDFVTRQNKQQQDNMLATAEVLNTQFSIIEGAVSQFTATLKDAGSDLRVALDAVKAELDYMNNPNEETERLSSEVQDRLHKKIIGETAEESFDIPVAMKNMTRNLTSRELSERINNYKRLKTKYGAVSLSNKSYFDDDVLSLGHGDKEILNSLKKQGVINHNYTSDITEEDLESLNEALEWLVSNESSLHKLTKASKDYSHITHNRSMGYDFVSSGNGNPMVTDATSVTKVNDGVTNTVISDSNDTAIFAKEGGPFDTLFNGIFDKINALYNMEERNYATASNVSSRFGDTFAEDTFAPVSMRSAHSQYNYTGGTSNRFGDTFAGDTLPEDPDVISRRFKPIVWNEDGNSRVMPNEAAMDEKFMAYQPPMERLYQGVDGVLGRERNTGNQGAQQPMKVEISGRLELTSGGQSVDIMQEIQNYPLLVRRLTEMIITQMNNNRNGGKNEMFGGGRYAG